MITKEQALTSDVFHWGNCTRAVGKRGGVKESSIVFRRNGKTQTWKRSPDRWRIPVKRGLYEYGDITPDRANEWHVPEDCPLNHAMGVVGVRHHQTRIQPVTVVVFPGRVFHRAVCTCGWTAKEHMPGNAGIALAEVDASEHLASVDASGDYCKGSC